MDCDYLHEPLLRIVMCIKTWDVVATVAEPRGFKAWALTSTGTIQPTSSTPAISTPPKASIWFKCSIMRLTLEADPPYLIK